MNSCKTLFLIFSFIFLVSCSQETGFKESKVFVGKQKIDADTLSLGKQVYLEYCMACHGMNGDGNGPAAKGSIPAPRNFQQGLYKFGLVKDGGLPTDEDFHRIIKGGLHGTGMLKWDIFEKQIFAVTQYIKTFAPQVWENAEGQAGEKLEFSVDPYGLARKDSAIERGKEVYHLTANCQSCHRAYMSHDELNNLYKKNNNGQSLGSVDEAMFDLKLQDSEYYFYDSKERFNKYLPPDFTWHEVRSAQTVDDLYKRLSAGVTGTGMPAWKGVLEEQDIWAVAYYVRSLMDLKNKPERKELIQRLGK